MRLERNVHELNIEISRLQALAADSSLLIERDREITSLNLRIQEYSRIEAEKVSEIALLIGRLKEKELDVDKWRSHSSQLQVKATAMEAELRELRIKLTT